jgi:ADP-heptose:LPS heptosyltransferase
MTWPALKALKRSHPDCELHFLTRPKFEAATEGLKVVDKHLQLPTTHLLEPMISLEPDMGASISRLDGFLNGLKGESYDWIINFTFSPFSSYLVHAIAGAQTRVTGYNRHSDGFLAIPDEVSAYFYAQAGVESFNRVHLTDIFISMLGLDYVEQDWAPPELDGRDFGLPEKYILVHIGASEAKKSLPPFKWARVLKNFFDHNLETAIVMIGSKEERALGEAIESGVSRGRVVNLIGATHLREVFHLLKGAQMLVGCDSAPMHMASLMETPCLNVSFEAVNFWETGPKATLSYIYRASFPEDIVSEELGAYIHLVLQGESPKPLIQRAAGLSSYQLPQEGPGLFAWNLIQALYLGEKFPVTDDMRFIQAVAQLNDVNTLSIEHIGHIPDKGLELMGPLLERGDEVIAAVGKMMPSVLPLVRWYQTEKLRIPPGEPSEVLRQTLDVHEKLQRILSVYVLDDSIRAHESKFKDEPDRR